MKLGLVGDYIAGLGLDAAKQHMESKIDEHKLKYALKEYIESERKYNDLCTMAEECDYDGAVFSSIAVVIRKEDRKRLEENTVAKREDSVHLLDKHRDVAVIASLGNIPAIRHLL